MSARIDRPGVYPDLAEADYHADPCPEPSLSVSVAKVLLDQSPLHAWAMHPRLNPAAEVEDPSAGMNIGSAVHAALLGKGADVVAIDAADFRTKAAREARDAAIADGRIPLIAEHAERVYLIAGAIREQLSRHEAAYAFVAGYGHAEVTLINRERSGVWLRHRVDWLPADALEPLYDLKTTALSANPDQWSRQLFSMGYDLQAALYTRTEQRLRGGARRPMRFVVAEIEPPYGVSVLQLDPAALALADRKADAALALWHRCTTTGRWPGYPARVCHVEAPPWMETRWAEREIREHADAKALAAAMNMHRPIGVSL